MIFIIKELKSQGLKNRYLLPQLIYYMLDILLCLVKLRTFVIILSLVLQNNAQWMYPEDLPFKDPLVSLSAVRFVDEIVVYNTEKDLEDILFDIVGMCVY
jgi:hypothetical protein